MRRWWLAPLFPLVLLATIGLWGGAWLWYVGWRRWQITDASERAREDAAYLR